MNRRVSMVGWAARVLGIGMAVFLAIFALDALEAGEPAPQVAADLALHLLPSAAVIAILALSWWRQWLGAAAFGALAVG